MRTPKGPTTGIILAGMFPWANSTFDRLAPRPLMPVAHRPLIWYGLSWLQRAEIDNVVVCGNRDTRAVESHLSRHFSGELNFFYLEDPLPRGAAGCVHDAALAGESQTFVVTDGAAIPNIDLPALLKNHHDSGAAATVVAHSGLPGHADPEHLTPTGVYVFEREALESIPRSGFVDIKEHLIPTLSAAGERVVTHASVGAMPRVLNAQTYLAVNGFMTQLRAASDTVLRGYHRRDEALVHAEASVADDVILAGPIIIGAGAAILSRAVLVGPMSIGREATVGRGALVSRSAVWRRSTIHAGAVVDRSIVADDAVVRAGRHEYGTIVASTKDRGTDKRRRPLPSPVTVAAPALDDRWQRLWLSLRTRSWTAIAVVGTDASADADRVAHILASEGARDGNPFVRVVSALGAQFFKTQEIVAQIADAARMGAMVLIPCDPLPHNPAMLHILSATAGVILVVRLGASSVASAKRAVDAVGRDRVFATVAID